MKSEGFLKGVLVGVCLMFGSVMIAMLIFFLFFKKPRYENFENGALSGSGSSTETFEAFADKEKYILNTINQYFYKDKDVSEIYDDVYRKLVDSLDDPYSYYFSEEELKSTMTRYDGEYVGIGCIIGQLDDSLELICTAVYEDSPAKKSGLQPGDIFISVNGTDITGMDRQTALAMLKGEEGETLKVIVKRDGENIELNITLDTIELKTITSQMVDETEKIGYIYCISFNAHTTDQFKAAIDDLEKQGMEKLIIDLRENHGGVYDAAVTMLDRMIEKDKLLVYTEDRNGDKESSYSEDDLKFDKPVVILINGNTASASELFTQTMRDYEKATVVGTRSFGKGIYQGLYRLGDGSGLRLTNGRYFSPKGICIHGEGIKPDIELELDEGLEKIAVWKRTEDNQLQAAIDYLKKNT